MAIDVPKLAQRLREFEEEAKQSEASKNLWKPKEGVQTVRIVPYKFNPGVPFIELKFYYKLAGKTYLAPCTFGKPDPIQEFVEKLRSSGVQAQRDLANKLEAKPRTFVPVIVRGEEEMGVRYWGFGKLVYKQLLKLMVNTKMWGDITSLTEGNDLEVEFHKISKKKTKDGQVIPDTSITPDPRKTPVVDPSKPELVQKVKDQVDILTCWTLPEYDELKAAMDRYLNPESDVENTLGGEENGDDDDNGSSAPISARPPSVPASDPVSATATATTMPAAAPTDLGKAFEEFFKT